MRRAMNAGSLVLVLLAVSRASGQEAPRVFFISVNDSCPNTCLPESIALLTADGEMWLYREFTSPRWQLMYQMDTLGQFVDINNHASDVVGLTSAGAIYRWGVSSPPTSPWIQLPSDRTWTSIDFDYTVGTWRGVVTSSAGEVWWYGGHPDDVVLLGSPFAPVSVDRSSSWASIRAGFRRGEEATR